MTDNVSLPAWIFTDKRVKPNHIRILAVRQILGAEPSAMQLAIHTGIDRSDVYAALRVLKELGLIGGKTHIERCGENPLPEQAGKPAETKAPEVVGEIPHSGENPHTAPLSSPPKDPKPQNTPPLIPPSNQNGRKALEDEFAAGFWKAYPRKVKRPIALKAYLAARRKVDAKAILDGLERYKRTKPEWQDWAHPTSWLNAERWADEPDAPNSQGPPSSSPERDEWAMRLSDFRRRNFWSAMWGPEPGKAGCRVPKDLLEEMAA